MSGQFDIGKIFSLIINNILSDILINERPPIPASRGLCDFNKGLFLVTKSRFWHMTRVVHVIFDLLTPFDLRGQIFGINSVLATYYRGYLEKNFFRAKGYFRTNFRKFFFKLTSQDGYHSTPFGLLGVTGCWKISVAPPSGQNIKNGTDLFWLWMGLLFEKSLKKLVGQTV